MIIKPTPDEKDFLNSLLKENQNQNPDGIHTYHQKPLTPLFGEFADYFNLQPSQQKTLLSTFSRLSRQLARKNYKLSKRQYRNSSLVSAARVPLSSFIPLCAIYKIPADLPPEEHATYDLSTALPVTVTPDPTSAMLALKTIAFNASFDEFAAFITQGSPSRSIPPRSLDDFLNTISHNDQLFTWEAFIDENAATLNTSFVIGVLSVSIADFASYYRIAFASTPLFLPYESQFEWMSFLIDINRDRTDIISQKQADPSTPLFVHDVAFPKFMMQIVTLSSQSIKDNFQTAINAYAKIPDPIPLSDDGHPKSIYNVDMAQGTVFVTPSQYQPNPDNEIHNEKTSDENEINETENNSDINGDHKDA